MYDKTYSFSYKKNNFTRIFWGVGTGADSLAVGKNLRLFTLKDHSGTCQ